MGTILTALVAIVIIVVLGCGVAVATVRHCPPFPRFLFLVFPPVPPVSVFSCSLVWWAGWWRVVPVRAVVVGGSIEAGAGAIWGIAVNGDSGLTSVHLCTAVLV